MKNQSMRVPAPIFIDKETESSKLGIVQLRGEPEFLATSISISCLFSLHHIKIVYHFKMISAVQSSVISEIAITNIKPQAFCHPGLTDS
jgi:hypothetical protein